MESPLHTQAVLIPYQSGQLPDLTAIDDVLEDFSKRYGCSLVIHDILNGGVVRSRIEDTGTQERSEIVSLLQGALGEFGSVSTSIPLRQETTLNASYSSRSTALKQEFDDIKSALESTDCAIFILEPEIVTQLLDQGEMDAGTPERVCQDIRETLKSQGYLNEDCWHWSHNGAIIFVVTLRSYRRKVDQLLTTYHCRTRYHLRTAA